MPYRQALGAIIRLATLGGVALLAAASTSSQQPEPRYGPAYASGGGAAAADFQPPPPQAMEPNAALGLFRSSFGAVKIEPDPERSGPGDIVGVWVYDRDGQEVIGLFEGELQGNVLQFNWHEPADPESLVGSGFLVFETDGSAFSGKWWTASGDRTGDWGGDKYQAEAGESGPAEPAPLDQDPYEGSPPTTM